MYLIFNIYRIIFCGYMYVYIYLYVDNIHLENVMNEVELIRNVILATLSANAIFATSPNDIPRQKPLFRAKKNTILCSFSNAFYALTHHLTNLHWRDTIRSLIDNITDNNFSFIDKKSVNFQIHPYHRESFREMVLKSSNFSFLLKNSILIVGTVSLGLFTSKLLQNKKNR